MAARRTLTDAEAWAVVTAPDLDAETLGRRLGVKPGTIRNARAPFRRQGWCCRVAYVPCRQCGGLLVQRGHRAGRATYHEACRPAARREIQHWLDRERWERMRPEDQAARLARAHARIANHEAATREVADNAGARWAAEEDGELLARWHEPAHVVAHALGRSLYAVKARKRHRWLCVSSVIASTRA